MGTDTQTAFHNFDNIYPWSARRRCCGYFDSAGNFVVNAYAGEPGYTTNGSNGEVWIEHSLFFYKHTYDGDAEEIVISSVQLPGYLPAPIFINLDGSLKQKAYTAAYPMATVNGKATSRAGVLSDVRSLNAALTDAHTMGVGYTVTTTAEWYTDCLYMWVEFGTRNLQQVMMGACQMSFVTTDTAAAAEQKANRIIVSAPVTSKYVLGQSIGIGTTIGNANIANNRIITGIEDYDEVNKAIVFNGAPVNVAVGNIVFSLAWINGSCDGVLSSSGSPVSNTSGRYNCVYRGKETPHGNTFELISDVLFRRRGAGTTDSPYSYDIYHLTNPAKYANGVITPDYVKLNYQLPTEEGHIKKLGIDNRYPHLRLPTAIGATTTTYYTDYYYRPAYDTAAACVGGGWIHGMSGGLC